MIKKMKIKMNRISLHLSFILFVVCCVCCVLPAAAQQTLNLHTTSQGLIRFAFTQNPQITFPEAELMRVTGDSLTVEFPFSEVEKITLDDVPTFVPILTVTEERSSLQIYDLGGRLLKQVASQDGSATLPLSTLPKGTYVIHDGKRSYKVRKE